MLLKLMQSPNDKNMQMKAFLESVSDNLVLMWFVREQVRLSRATLEFQALQVPSGLKVFNNQVISVLFN